MKVSLLIDVFFIVKTFVAITIIEAVSEVRLKSMILKLNVCKVRIDSSFFASSMSRL